jgi:hypothetical protein
MRQRVTLSLPLPTPRPEPRLARLEAGTIVWRVHSDCFEPAQFNPTIPTPFSGGRFDSTDGSYAYLYAGSDTIAPVAETLLRDRPPSGAFLVPRERVQGKLLSRLRLIRELLVVVLHGAGLSAIRQTAELTSSGAGDYASCRAWARALRVDAPLACGFEWRPRHDNDRLAYVFFGDCCSSSDFVSERSYALTQGAGVGLLKRALARHSATFTFSRIAVDV